jgi:hypothetical protein
MTSAKPFKMTRERYLTPDPNVPAPWPTPRTWTPPSSRGLRGKRKIGFKSTQGTARAAIQVNGYMEGAESNLELYSGLWLLAQPDVVDIISQWPQVSYVDDGGIAHRFTFDFTSVHTDGSRTANSVKPQDLVAASQVEEIHLLLQRQMSAKTANRINLITEEKLAPQDRFNAEAIYAARRFPVPAHDAVIEGLIADLHGTTTVGALRELSGLRGAAYRAIVRTIAAGRLETVEHVRIDSGAVVRRPQTRKA